MNERWSAYVRAVAGADTPQAEIARRTGVNQSTISRWVKGEADVKAPDAGNVALFCRAYSRNPVEGFVAAGLLTAEEASLRRPQRAFLAKLKSRQRVEQETPPHVREAIEEGERRLKEERRAAQPQAGDAPHPKTRGSTRNG